MLINNRNLFLAVAEAGSVRSGCRHDWILVRAVVWVADGHLLTISSCSRKRTELSGGPVIQAVTPFIMELPAKPTSLTLGVRISVYEFGRTGTFGPYQSLFSHCFTLHDDPCSLNKLIRIPLY